MLRRYFVLIILMLQILSGNCEENELYNKLKQIKDIEIMPLDTKGQGEGYTLMIPQLIDHQNPNSGYFKQRVFLCHKDFTAPVVYVTEGYSARGVFNEELADLLKANTIIIEHRNFGKSIADTVTWATMTVEQAATDDHVVCRLLKAIYPGKWVSTGVSKGGQTSLFYRAYFPSDVDVTVAYVAPVNRALEDKRLNTFIGRAGDGRCRKKIYDFQMELLKNKATLVPAYANYCKKHDFNLVVDPEIAFDYSVLEYPFGFWQYGSPCDSIPSIAKPKEELLNQLVKVNSPFYYSSNGVNFFKPFFYQANYELGYYGYDEKPFRRYLKQKDYPNTIWGPTGKILPFNPKTMKFVNHFLQNEGDRIIYIYGEYDPWSASQVELTGKTDALKVIIAKGDHSSCIGQMSETQREEVYDRLTRWLDRPLTK